MARLIGIDWGRKRTGIAVSDPLGIFATGLTTLAPAEVVPFLQQYAKQESLKAFVVGQPYRADGSLAQSEPEILVFIDKLKAAFPGKPVYRQDESFTSRDAVQALIKGGATKKQRQQKELVDQVSATLILRQFMEEQQL